MKNLKEQINIYTLVVADVDMIAEKFKSFEIPKNYLSLKKLFDKEKTKVLSEQNQKNHVINLMKNIESLNMLLYNLF